ncbi:hypothetical protein [Streptomyces sp. TLI_146]|uniref:hypothetical protein n=1 Tax=Streptomyces sp. TLI_146 TaxID=1938858 RepID=UPI000CC2EEB3|nr:hypothetical protein [Streptomyces sp. TLI_146]PKV83197.1 hypothetical protein BX283_0694 [Streptomyces sp. TLI_146]
MGERLSGDGVPVRHRHGRAGGPASDPGDAHGFGALEAVLAAALRADDLDPEAERRALNAFRAAAHGAAAPARTRRCDDWRRPEERGVRHPLRMTFGVVFASLALGGVAVAAIGSATSPSDGTDADRATARPSASTPTARGGAALSAPPRSSGPTDRPSPAEDTADRCRAYEQTLKDGQTPKGTAWQRLVDAAGGKSKVPAYCAEELTRATATPRKPTDTDKRAQHPAGPGNGTPDKSGASGTGTSGGNPGGTHGPSGSGQRSGGEPGTGKHPQ